jgi:hypothetical protein
VEENGHRLNQSQSNAKLAFEVFHFAVICFVIVTHEMQQAVQDENLQLARERPAEAPRIPLCDDR